MFNLFIIPLIIKFVNALKPVVMVSTTNRGIYQEHFIAPAIDDFWEETQLKTFEELQNQNLIVVGDGRNDSPGHSSKNLSYSIAYMDSQKILSVKSRDVRHAAGKSVNMEILGFQLAMKEVHELGERFGIKMTDIVTDGHTQIKKLLARKSGIYQNIKHSLDIWHASKSILKKLTEQGKKKGCEALTHWAPLIRNHFWYCARESEGDVMVMKYLWMGLLQHICNVHEWNLPLAYGAPTSCLHDDLTPEQIESHEWLMPSSEQFDGVRKIITGANILNNLGYFVNFRHNDFLETFHSMLVKYASKRFAFSYKVYDMRVKLAAIDHNSHTGRKELKTKDGKPRYNKCYSKRSKAWYIVKVYEPKEYRYLDSLILKVFEKRANFNGNMRKRAPLPPDHPESIHKNIGMVDCPQKSDLIERQASRFIKNNNTISVGSAMNVEDDD